MPWEELLKQGFAVLIAGVLIWDIIKSRKEMSARIAKLEDHDKKILEGLVREAIRTNQQLCSILSHCPCNEDKE